VTVDVSVDGRDEFFRIAEDTATKAVLSEVVRDADVRMAPAIKQKVVCTTDAGRCCVSSGAGCKVGCVAAWLWGNSQPFTTVLFRGCGGDGLRNKRLTRGSDVYWATGVEIPVRFISRHCRSPRKYCHNPCKRQIIVTCR